MKKGILLTLVLVVIIGLICGCILNSKFDSNSKENKASEINKDGNSNQTTQNDSINKISIEGLYVSHDENFEAVFIKEIENKYALVFKSSGMSYFAVIDVKSDSVIEGNLGEDTYKITQDGENIKLDFSMDRIENLSLTRFSSSDAYGVYRDEYRFVALYKDFIGDTKAFYYDAQKERFSYLEPLYNDVQSNKASFGITHKGLEVTIGEDSTGYNITVSGSYKQWGFASGKYEKIF